MLHTHTGQPISFKIECKCSEDSTNACNLFFPAFTQTCNWNTLCKEGTYTHIPFTSTSVKCFIHPRPGSFSFFRRINRFCGRCLRYFVEWFTLLVVIPCSCIYDFFYSHTSTFSFYFIFLKIIYFIHVYGHFALMYIYAPSSCGVYGDRRGSCWIPGNWSFRWSLSVTWILRAKPGFSARAASVLNVWAISPLPHPVASAFKYCFGASLSSWLSCSVLFNHLTSLWKRIAYIPRIF